MTARVYVKNSGKYYHIWFQTKARRKILSGDVDKMIHGIFSRIASEKGYELVEFETSLDHAHLLLRLLPVQDLSFAVKMFKGISARRVFQEFPELKFQIRSNNFWARKYGSKEIDSLLVPKVKEYIKNQQKEF